MLMIVMFGITTLILAASVARTSDKTALGGLVGSTATFCLLIGKFFRYKNLERLHHNFVTTEDPKKRAAIKELIQNQGTPRKNRRGKRRKLEEDEEEPT